ncbi:MAG: hypothetical protein E7456_01135 [Ruminococcaceae bacterium]|nr:hypothetical protein [Oscillospiraceae bacterium]
MKPELNNNYSKKAFVLELIQTIFTVLYFIIINVPPIQLPISFISYQVLSFILGITAFAGIFTGFIGLHILKKAKKRNENSGLAIGALIMSIFNIVIGFIPVGIVILLILMLVTSPGY